MPKKEKDKYFPLELDEKLKEEDYEEYKYSFLVMQYDLGPVLTAMDKNQKAEYGDFLADYQTETIGKPMNPLHTAVEFPASPEMNYYFDDETNERARKVAENNYKAINRYLENIDDEHAPFVSNIRLLANINNPDNGNLLKMMSEDQMIYNLRSQAAGGSPDIFLDPTAVSDSKKNLKTSDVTRWTRENGIQTKLMDFFEATNDVFSMEFMRDREKETKKNWDSKKERQYLLGLESAYSRMVENFEELRKVPMDVSTDGHYMGNNLSHLTGVAPGEGRDAMASVETARIKRDAIRQGWTSDGLQALNAPAYFAGRIKKNIYQAELSGDTKTAERLKEFDEKTLKPFMDDLLGKKITCAKDMYDSIKKIEKFAKKIENEKLVAEPFNDSFAANSKVIIPRCKNNLIDAHEREAKTGKPEKGLDEKEFAKSDLSASMKELIDQIRKTDDPAYQKGLAAAYIQNKFLNGRTIAEDEGLFNSKRVDYKPKMDVLYEMSEQYAQTMIERMKPENGNELADMLELGEHQPFFVRMKDAVKGAGAKSAYEDFVKGSPSGSKIKKNLNEVHQMMKDADDGIISFSDFGNVMKALPALDEQRKKIAVEFRKTLFEGKEINLNSKQFKKYEKNVEEAYRKVNSYLESKEKKIREKGGDPATAEGIELLGETGAKRYKAMREARKQIKEMKILKYNLKENTPTRKTAAMFKESKKNIVMDEVDFRESVYIEKFREQKNRLRDARQNEFEIRIKEKGNNDKIVASAERDLYADTVSKIFEDRLNEFMDGMKKDELKNDPKAVKETNKKFEKLYKEYKEAVDDCVTVENGKQVFKADSKQFDSFKKGVLADGDPFTEKFKDEVIKTTSQKPIANGGISTLRDEALVKCLETTKDAKDIQKYQKLSKAFGSDAAKKFDVKVEKLVENQKKKAKAPVKS